MIDVMLMWISIHALFHANHKRVLWRLTFYAYEAGVYYPSYEVPSFILLLSMHVWYMCRWLRVA